MERWVDTEARFWDITWEREWREDLEGLARKICIAGWDRLCEWPWKLQHVQRKTSGILTTAEAGRS